MQIYIETKRGVKIDKPLYERLMLESINNLQNEQNNYDTEVAHHNADKIICNLLEQLGFEEIVNEYYKVDKWYA